MIASKTEARPRLFPSPQTLVRHAAMFYVDLFSALDRHKVDYLLIGGLAVSLHGVERATMDVDITVAMNPDNLSALIETAKHSHCAPRNSPASHWMCCCSRPWSFPACPNAP